MAFPGLPPGGEEHGQHGRGVGGRAGKQVMDDEEDRHHLTIMATGEVRQASHCRPANHFRKPTLFSPSAIATSVANQTSTLHACLLVAMSSN